MFQTSESLFFRKIVSVGPVTRSSRTVDICVYILYMMIRMIILNTRLLGGIFDMWFKIKKLFKQLWCDHIWKVSSTVPLYETFKHIDHIAVPGSTRRHVALYMKCIKCGKMKIEREIERCSDSLD